MDNVFTELEYLSNPALYEKYKNKKQHVEDNKFIKEKKFYRKRIIQLTKDLYTNNLNNYNTPIIEISNSFDKYVKECIDFLKQNDKNDIIQDDYKDLIVNDTKSTVDASLNMFENDNLLANKPSVNKIEDCFPITKTKTKTNKSNPPQKKKLNLKDPKFKVKGLNIKE